MPWLLLEQSEVSQPVCPCCCRPLPGHMEQLSLSEALLSCDPVPSGCLPGEGLGETHSRILQSLPAEWLAAWDASCRLNTMLINK